MAPHQHRHGSYRARLSYSAIARSFRLVAPSRRMPALSPSSRRRRLLGSGVVSMVGVAESGALDLQARTQPRRRLPGVRRRGIPRDGGNGRPAHRGQSPAPKSMPPRSWSGGSSAVSRNGNGSSCGRRSGKNSSSIPPTGGTSAPSPIDTPRRKSPTPSPIKASQGLTKSRLMIDPGRGPVVVQVFTWRTAGAARQHRRPGTSSRPSGSASVGHAEGHRHHRIRTGARAR